MAANASWGPVRPSDTPSHEGRHPISAAATTRAKGSSRRSRSGAIHAQLSGIRVRTVRVGRCDVMEFELYFDYLCPFVYRASLLLTNVAAERNPQVRWRYFSLAQVNSTQPGWTAWDAPATDRVRGRFGFKA